MKKLLSAIRTLWTKLFSKPPEVRRDRKRAARSRQRGIAADTFVIGMVVLAIGALLLATFIRVGTPRYSEGTRVGELIKFTRSGVFCKTWEGELKLQEGGSSQSDNGRWDFTVEDIGTAATAQGLIGQRVMVAYYEKGANLNRCTGASRYRAERIMAQAAK